DRGRASVGHPKPIWGIRAPPACAPNSRSAKPDMHGTGAHVAFASTEPGNASRLAALNDSLIDREVFRVGPIQAFAVLIEKYVSSVAVVMPIRTNTGALPCAWLATRKHLCGNA